MGLDMYLYSKKPLNEGDLDVDVYKSEEDLAKMPAEEKQSGGWNDPFPNRSYFHANNVMKEAQWRKANAVHRWFVEQTQGGEDLNDASFVTRAQLEELVDVCRKVDADHDQAAELLPTQGGFFFGPTEYDEWYFMGITETLEMVPAALERHRDDPAVVFIYESSW